MSRRFFVLLSVVILQTSCGTPRREGPASEHSKPQQTGTMPAETQVAELQGKITKWQSNRDKLKKLLEQMQKDKTGILERLVQLGVKSENDLANSPKGQVLHGELKDIVKQIALYDKKYQDYDLAILKSESRVRSVARQLAAREAGVSDTELEELTRSMVTLDESLSSEKEAAVPIDLKDTLKDELARYHQGPQTALSVTANPSQSTRPVEPPSPKPSTADVSTSQETFGKIARVPAGTNETHRPRTDNRGGKITGTKSDTYFFTDEATIKQDWAISGTKWRIEKGGILLIAGEDGGKLHSRRRYTGDIQLTVVYYPITGAWINLCGTLIGIKPTKGRVVSSITRRGDTVVISVNSKVQDTRTITDDITSKALPIRIYSAKPLDGEVLVESVEVSYHE